MDLPAFYDPSKVGQLYEPDLQRSYQTGLTAFQSPASDDRTHVLLWLIDVQVDFVFPAPVGRLPVPNAVADTQRTVEWLYRNLQDVTHIAASLDTHLPLHIFFASWWQNTNRESPAPYTVITREDVQQGKWAPIFEPEWSVYYLETLESVGKKKLMIWPFHCMEGTAGNGLVPALSEAIMVHSGARRAQPTYLIKGTIPQTEFYSVVEPEVKLPNRTDTNLNAGYLEHVGHFDLIYVAGQARSHCVLETMNSMLRHFDSSVIGKIRFLNDCTSSIPGFEQETEARIAEFAAAGVRLVKSTDPIG